MKKNYTTYNKKNVIATSLVVIGTAAISLLTLPFLAQAQVMTTTAASATLYRQIDIGMSGADVTALQTYLATDPTVYPEGLITGYFGALTGAAVSRYQTKNGLASVGRVGPQTLAMLSGGIVSGGGTGGSDDVSAPILYPETVRTSSNSATFTWNTNEPALASVTYGGTWPFLFASAPVVQGTGGISTYQTVTLNNLQPHTTYYYVIMSTDQSGNVNQTVGKPFVTTN
jgi:peptidoglycan hydrolase-like protein with peptidoglycan-binding domain